MNYRKEKQKMNKNNIEKFITLFLILSSFTSVFPQETKDIADIPITAANITFFIISPPFTSYLYVYNTISLYFLHIFPLFLLLIYILNTKIDFDIIH